MRLACSEGARPYGLDEGEPASRGDTAGPYLGGRPTDPLTFEDIILNLVRTAAQQGFGSADSLLDLTPYQLSRLLGWKPTPPQVRVGGTARLLELRGMLT